MSDNYTKLTIENIADYPAGTKLEFNFGAYYPTHEGVVTGYEIIPASKWFPAAVRLTAVYDDLDGGVVETTVSDIAVRGIGTYLRPDMPEFDSFIDDYYAANFETVTPNKKSPWAA